MPASDPVPPFGATVAGVEALLPDATIYDVLPAGRKGVTKAQTAAWLDELSGRVAIRLGGWARLRATVLDGEPVDAATPYTQLVDAARTVVHNGAASYVEAARFPERAAAADTSYAGVLWARFTDGLADLAGWLERELAEADNVDVVEPGPVDADAPLGNFPAAVGWSGVPF